MQNLSQLQWNQPFAVLTMIIYGRYNWFMTYSQEHINAVFVSHLLSPLYT